MQFHKLQFRTIPSTNAIERAGLPAEVWFTDGDGWLDRSIFAARPLKPTRVVGTTDV